MNLSQGVAAVVAVLIAASAPSHAGAGDVGAGASPGSDGAGDSYYPQDGNGGYDVAGYDLSLDYQPSSRELSGTALITAKATQDLSAFDLDLTGLTVTAVTVNGAAAKSARRGAHELVITPATALSDGAAFTVKVAYHGKPGPIGDADDGNGWHVTSSGAAYVQGEPQSASAWFPVNDTARDKATFRFAVTVPKGWTAIANGREGTTNANTVTWTESAPMAPYLATLAIDKFRVDRGKLADGTPVVSAFAPGTSKQVTGYEARLPEILDFLSVKFGPYPFDAAGGIFLTGEDQTSLESQTRPIYAEDLSDDIETVVHENAHQWWGDSVSVRSWKDICLNECFASYTEWLWDEAKDKTDLDARYRKEVDDADSKFWSGKLDNPGAGHEFDDFVYDKGALALHALRRQIGDKAFAAILKGWPAKHRGGNADWPEFEKYVAAQSGKNLDGFFAAWFHDSGKPAAKYLYPGSLG